MSLPSFCSSLLIICQAINHPLRGFVSRGAVAERFQARMTRLARMSSRGKVNVMSFAGGGASGWGGSLGFDTEFLEGAEGM